MFARSSSSNPTPRPSRRTFVKGLAIGGAAASVGLLRQPAWAQPRQRQESAVLSGTEFDLRIGETEVNLTGSSTHGAHHQRLAAGAAAAVARGGHRHAERLEQPGRGHVDSLARHPAARQHGRRARPQLRGHPSGPAYRYRFTVKQSGTYWYHSHSGFQEQQGVYGPIVIEPREPDPVRFDREHVVMLTDWTDERPSVSSRS